jgi:uracil-DNA glycosylase family 4
MRCSSVGPTTARIAIVGEAPGENEEREGRPFCGTSGHELRRMLAEAKIDMDSCYITNVVMERPPNNDLTLWINKNKTARPGEVKYRGKWVQPLVVNDVERLYKELAALKPHIIIALGNTALWALTPHTSVDKWRGSLLKSDLGFKLIPAYHPAFVLRVYETRYITIQDFRRAKAHSATSDIAPSKLSLEIDPSFKRTKEILWALDNGPPARPIVCDIEIKRNEILCVGFGWSANEAICIPFYDGRLTGPLKYRWSPEEHIEVVLAIQKLLRSPHVLLVNQNISFDIQYLFWRFNVWPHAHFDTMLAQHVMFPGAPKDLAYLASMWAANYVYWKDDGKFWDKPVIYPELWRYNCLDCTYTYEVMEQQQKMLAALGLEPQMAFIMRLFHHVMKMMMRGVRIDLFLKPQIAKALSEHILALVSEAEYLAARSLTGDKGGFSSQKLQKLFYTDLGFSPIKKKVAKKMAITCDDEALAKLAKKEPLIKPLTHRINTARSFNAVMGAVSSKTDIDGRW